MSKFNEEEIELLESQFECEGFEETIKYNGEASSIICNHSELSKQLFDVANAYEQYEHYLKILSHSLRKEGIDTFY